MSTSVGLNGATTAGRFARATEPGVRRRPVEHVLVATDLSLASAAATDRAIDLAAALGARLLVVSVIDPGARRSGLRVDQIRTAREAEVSTVVAAARGQGVAAEYLIWTGTAGESIVEAAASEGVDLIVVGSRGRGGVERAVLGSVSDYVIRHAPCPVMVLRNAQT
ncbi:MAG TPA: universal stress protein [Candidatus Limnocylindrales bacterium]